MAEEKKWCVYMHTNKINGKRYVGITCQAVQTRWGKTGNKYKGQPFYNAISKYGWDSFEHEILEENLTLDDANKKEIYYIKEYRTHFRFKDCNGYNSTLGGEGSSGYIPSDEARRKISEWHKGKTTWNKGKRYSIPQMSNIQAERWKDDKYRQNMIDKNIGKKLTEETKNKISKNNPRRISVYQMDKDTFEILNKFESVSDAVAYMSNKNLICLDSGIFHAINGRISESYGYKWITVYDYKNKTELYYKILNAKTIFRTILCVSPNTLEIVERYYSTNQLRLNYDDNHIERIKARSRRLTRKEIDGNLWCFFSDYEEFKKKVVDYREKKGVKCE